MKKQKLWIPLALLGAFVLWTAAVCEIDVREIGPAGSAVGFGGLNGFFHSLTGVHLWLYVLTDWLSLIPAALAAGFALLGMTQWIRRKSLWKVDFSLLALGGFYLAVMAAYLFFEEAVVNYRPVLIEGVLEASYPSSTTLLVLCVMPTAGMQLRRRIRNRAPRAWVTAVITVFTVFMAAARLLSGVHWLTDIIGGILLSAALVAIYAAVIKGRQ